MTIEAFSGLCRELAATPRRLEKTALVAEALRGLDPEEVPWAVAFLAGRPCRPRTPGTSG